MPLLNIVYIAAAFKDGIDEERGVASWVLHTLDIYYLSQSIIFTASAVFSTVRAKPNVSSLITVSVIGRPSTSISELDSKFMRKSQSRSTPCLVLRHPVLCSGA
jgi:hypothetical protein